VCFRDKAGAVIQPCVLTDENGHYIQNGFLPYKITKKKVYAAFSKDGFKPKTKKVKIRAEEVPLNFKVKPLAP
jgi:hypothetical protein